LTDLLAGLAANSIGSFVKGFTPLRASVAGLFTTDILAKPGMTNSQWFSPLFMTRDLTVILHHAYHLAKGFPSSEAVELRCEWSGLLERELAEAHPQLRTAWSRGRIARVDHRITQGEWSIADIPNAWPEMVSALGGPVMRLFDTTFDYSPNWVREQGVTSPRLSKLC
jgi:hypothetical protein